MHPTLRDEFRWTGFALRFHKREVFCEAQWRWPRAVFVLYRLVMCAYSLFALIHTAVKQADSDSRHNFMVFLTNWTYTVETLFFLWGAVLTVCCLIFPRHFQSCDPQSLCKVKDIESDGKVAIENAAYIGYQAYGEQISAGTSKEREQSSLKTGSGSSGQGKDQTMSLPWYIQAYWCLSNVVQVMAIVVTITYFGALYSPSQGVSLDNFNLHAINSVMVVFEVIVCARPVRLLHVVYPIVYGLAYVVFSVIYWSQDHENNVLYENVLDWNHPGTTCGVVVGLALVGIPLLQLVHYGIYRLRLCCYHRIYGEKYL